MTRDERIAAVRLLLPEGISAEKMAARFNGATRNCIIGLCRRHDINISRPEGLPVRAPKLKPPRKRKVRAVATPEIVDRPSAQPTTPPSATAVLFTDTKPHHCKWPLWRHHERPSVTAMFVCGAASIAGKPYCPYHAHVARPARED